jgi:hypothetical protein
MGCRLFLFCHARGHVSQYCIHLIWLCLHTTDWQVHPSIGPQKLAAPRAATSLLPILVNTASHLSCLPDKGRLASETDSQVSQNAMYGRTPESGGVWCLTTPRLFVPKGNVSTPGQFRLRQTDRLLSPKPPPLTISFITRPLVHPFNPSTISFSSSQRPHTAQAAFIPKPNNSPTPTTPTPQR